MISKMKPEGSRIGVVFNGSPLFTGDAGSGESEIRRWIIENDFLECIVSLPDRLFFNTGISTYVWVVTNKKKKQRKGKVQLIDLALSLDEENLGEKSKRMDDDQTQQIISTYLNFEESDISKIFDNSTSGTRRW